MGIEDILDALKFALTKEGIGIESKGKGNGLHYTSKLIKTDKSKTSSMLTILSENGLVKITSGHEPIIEKVNTFWNGTIVTLALSPNIQTNIEDIMDTKVFNEEDLPDLYS